MENQPETVALSQSKSPENMTSMRAWQQSTERKGNGKQKREVSRQFSRQASDAPLPPHMAVKQPTDFTEHNSYTLRV